MRGSFIKKNFQCLENKKRIFILDVPVDVLTLNETLRLFKCVLQNGEYIIHMSVNAAKIVKMKRDRELFKSVVSADIINADGMSIVWASKILGNPLPERVAGVDLMENLVEIAWRNGYKIFFFGAREDVVRKVVDIYSEKYSPEIVAGFRNGYYSTSEERKIAKEISRSGANILFVAMSTPKKEKFIFKNRDILKNINIVMGVGGAFDVIAGKVKRAPKLLQDMGMEWFWRFLQEPTRMWRRIYDYLLFTLMVFYESFSRNRK